MKFEPRAHPGIIAQHYRMLELQSRVESASPHGLVGILYEELLRSLDLAIASVARGKALSGSGHITKALSIIVALDGSLDLEKGGALATTLARIYRSCRQGLNEAVKTGNAEKLQEIREAISDIAYAWQALAAN